MLKDYNIHYIQPYSISKNIGQIYNEACFDIPAHDWICITDQDTLFLHPESKKQIYDVITNYGNEYSAFGCITNRLRRTEQLYNNHFETSSDILYHKKIADFLHTTKYGIIREVYTPIAGLFMLFNKQTWLEYPFKENNLAFDTLWSQALLNNNRKIALIEGLYLFHFYRLDKEDPINSIEHLQ